MRLSTVAIGVVAQVAVAPLAPTAAAQVAERQIQHGGVTRSYLIQAPPAARSYGASLPALIVLHGGGSRARQIMAHTRFNSIAAREAFIALYPQGVRGHWNDGRDAGAAANNMDDVGFAFAMLEDVEQQGIRVDRMAVGVTGISNGGFMAMRIACEAAERIAGIAAVTAMMPAKLGGRCRPARPVAVLVINGTDDPLVPYEGGHVRVFGRNHGAIWSTARTMQFWTNANGCGGAPRSAALPDRDPGDGTTTIRHDYPGCGRAPVTLLEVRGGGHTWPGGPQYLPAGLIGPVSRDFDASEAIVDFFKPLWRRSVQ